MSVSQERAALLQLRLAALEEAEFKLVAGSSAASVAYEGESVTFRSAAGGLHQIRDLKNRIRKELGMEPVRQTLSRRVVVR